jgi:hypothetical protein
MLLTASMNGIKLVGVFTVPPDSRLVRKHCKIAMAAKSKRLNIAKAITKAAMQHKIAGAAGWVTYGNHFCSIKYAIHPVNPQTNPFPMKLIM